MFGLRKFSVDSNLDYNGIDTKKAEVNFVPSRGLDGSYTRGKIMVIALQSLSEESNRFKLKMLPLQ